MQVKKIFNAQYLVDGAISMQLSVQHDGKYLEIPFVYRKDDNSALSVQLTRLIEMGAWPDIAPYRPPSQTEIMVDMERQCREIQKNELSRVSLHLTDDSLTANEIKLLKKYRADIKAVSDQKDFPLRVVWPDYPDVL